MWENKGVCDLKPDMLLHVFKKFVPTPMVDVYHRVLSFLAAFWYGHPSRQMIVIGVTGTNGKTTTSYMISKVLEVAGTKTGCTTTALFKVADREWLNDTKMTMLGRFKLQKLLRQMVDAGCRYAVVETSSQGIVQHRHEHIAYDVLVFTNLTPEHIEAHGGFDAYQKAKTRLFEYTAALPEKRLDGVLAPRAAVINRDDEHAEAFARQLSKNIWYGMDARSDLRMEELKEDATGISFSVRDKYAHLPLMGRVNAWNALASLAVAEICGIDFQSAVRQLELIRAIPGRFEPIVEGQPWTVLVDYAPEPASLVKLYQTIVHLHPARVIHVLGSCGGGRDVARRPVLGRLAGEYADVVIVTNEDPYDDDPLTIIEQVAQGAREAGKIQGQNLFLEPDRRAAIEHAMRIARPKDLVLLTGKGCEQWICGPAGSKIAWDERTVARDAIRAALAERLQTS